MIALEIVAAVLMVAGSLVVAIAAFGVVSLADPFMRMHAATKAGVVGAGLVLLGVGLSFGTVSAFVTGLAGLVFLFATVPIASHVLGRATYVSGVPLAPATIGDALAGVLPRNVFDIDPRRTSRPPRPVGPAAGAARPRKEESMSAIQFRQALPASSLADPAALRRITTWLIGGPCQAEATGLSVDLAAANGARLIGVTAIDVADCEPGGAMPVGGMAWARWLADQRRGRMRANASDVLAAFNHAVAEAGVDAGTRHEEGGFADFATVTSGSDLIVVPAGVDRFGERADYAEEVAALLAEGRLGPVLRVRRRPLGVRRVLLLVGTTPNCPRLAQTLLASGLWPDATVTVQAVGPHRPQVEALAREQVELLRAHDRDVTLGAGIELDFQAAELRDRALHYQAAVLGALTTRVGWFDAVRENAHEIVADSVAATLLP